MGEPEVSIERLVSEVGSVQRDSRGSHGGNRAVKGKRRGKASQSTKENKTGEERR